MSNSNNNRLNIPEAKQGMEQFKMQDSTGNAEPTWDIDEVWST